MALIDPQYGPATYQKQARPAPEALVRSHMPLVRKLAWHVHARVASAIDVEDLVQIGMVALVESANCFEDRGHAFATYATVRIRGAMIDHLRRHATLCRAAIVRRRELAAVRQRLENRLGRAAGDAEMAEEMGLDPADYRALVDDSQAVHQESIEEVYSDHSMWFADVEAQADEAIDRSRLKSAVAEAIGGLPERDAMVLQLYFVEEMNLEEIGQTLGVGAARICQIKKAALDRVRMQLQGWC
jgi:RNA polymerase sigma factor for flagellar operon FliA